MRLLRKSGGKSAERGGRSRLMRRLVSGRGKKRFTAAGFHGDLVRALERFFRKPAVYKWDKGTFEIPERFVKVSGLGSLPYGTLASFNPNVNTVSVNPKLVDEAALEGLRGELTGVSAFHAQGFQLVRGV
jgi:hypothetical protein